MAGPAAQSRPQGKRGRDAIDQPGRLRRPPASPFSSDANTCTLEGVQLAGIPIRDQDVFKLAGLLRTGGFENVADKLTRAVLIETKVCSRSPSRIGRQSSERSTTRLMASPSFAACSCVNTSGACRKGSFDRMSRHREAHLTIT